MKATGSTRHVSARVPDFLFVKVNGSWHRLGIKAGRINAKACKLTDEQVLVSVKLYGHTLTEPSDLDPQHVCIP
jgi:hypothetical protein